MEPQEIEGGCFCGAVRYRASGEPMYRLVCHCRSCRLTSGSPGVPWMTFQKENFLFEKGEPKRFQSSESVGRTFCSACGTSLTYEISSRPGEVDVTQGSLDDPNTVAPVGHIWMEDAPHWQTRIQCLPQAQRGGPAKETPWGNAGPRTWVSPKAKKGQTSAIEGKGIVAHESITAGEVVAVKGGHIVSRDELLGLSEHLQNSEIGIADGMHIAARHNDEYDSVMLYLNHSCDPNVGVQGNIVFVAMRAIDIGEELTVDYAMFDDHPELSMTCNCGTGQCRKIINGMDWKLPQLQKRYQGYFSAFLEAKIRTSSR